MDTKWKNLANPPVVTAIFQLKFDSDSIRLDDYLKFDTVLKREFPKRSENIESSLSLAPSTRIPLGKAQVSGVTDTRRTGYVYFTTDQKEKLTLAETEITYTKESPYTGWDSFKDFVLKILQTLSTVLEGVTIQRTSIRFINQFNLKEFDDPTEYFNTQITSSASENSMPYPLLKYGFRMTFDIAEGIYSIVNQNADHLTDKYIYIFDIDVLDRNNILFDVNSIDETLENLRVIKNNIFFGNLTNKTLELCS
ncbi:MAG: TIGR04255 family protein [Prevotella sp.]|nr:TIGR04255 family protein [Prevotella sp.]